MSENTAVNCSAAPRTSSLFYMHLYVTSESLTNCYITTHGYRGNLVDHCNGKKQRSKLVWTRLLNSQHNQML